MVLMRPFDRFRGGRIIFFIVPTVIMGLAIWLVRSSTLIEIENIGSVFLYIAICYIYWPNLKLFFRDNRSAAAMWWGTGIVGIAVATIWLNLWSTYWHLIGKPNWPMNNFIVETIKYIYWCSAGCFFLAPQAREDIIPPRGWLLLIGLNALAIVVALTIHALFTVN